jgi:hypothetical protein
MDFLKTERLKISMLFIGVFLIASFLVVNSLNFNNFVSEVEKTPVSTPNKEAPHALPLSTSDAVKKIYQEYGYGPGPRFIASDDKRVWFAPPSETDACSGQYYYIELATGEEIESALSACQEIPISASYPFYVSVHWDDVVTLNVVNLLTLEQKTVYTLARDKETMIKGCYDESEYGPICKTDIQIANGELLLNVYKMKVRKMNEIYENKELLRTATIDLLPEFGMK